jgi:hypothetical protein
MTNKIIFFATNVILVVLAGCNLRSVAAFTPKSHAIFLASRGGSDFPPNGDPNSPTFETTVIQDVTPSDDSNDASPTREESTSVEVIESTVPIEAKNRLNPTLANAIERTGPAIFMLVILYILLRSTGEKGLLYGLVPLMQFGMYSETTRIIESFHQRNNRDMEVKLEKWWWFLTVFVSTTLRGFGNFGNLTGETIDFLAYSMVAIGLLMAVIGMARHEAAGPEMFRKYLGELAAFHFALVSVSLHIY